MSDIPPRQMFPNDGGVPRYEPATILPAEFIQTDVVCAACRYNLRGQPRDGRCPECGAPVMEAFRFGQLTFCDAAWLRRVRSGMVIGFWCIIAGIALSCIVSALVVAVGFNPHSPQAPTPNQQMMFQISGAILWIPMFILGMVVVHRLTSPEPRPDEAGPLERARSARAAILLSWILIGVFVVNMVVSLFWSPTDPFAFANSTPQIVYMIGNMVAWYRLSYAIFILVGVHLRSIARRDASPSLGRLFTVLIWGSGVNLLTMVGSTVMSLMAMQAVSAMAAAAATQAASQVVSHGGHTMSTSHTTIHTSTTQLAASMPVTRFIHTSSTPFTTLDAIFAPLMALVGCFGLVWFILLVITAIQFYRMLSKAITHNVGMANVFAVRPPPAADSTPFG